MATETREIRRRKAVVNQWMPSFGATVCDNGTRFRVWAPKVESIIVEIEQAGSDLWISRLERQSNDTFEGFVKGAKAGDRYRFRIDDAGPYPDPASRFQPLGVHGPSEIVDAGEFEWTDAGWSGISPAETVIYELHVGTFSPDGTFNGVTSRLEDLRDLGVTAIELMPIAEFAGCRSWGYDGVDLFAPARCYGRPDDLRRLVDTAHKLGIAVFLDVVYNHFGPVGNYALEFSPYYISQRSSAWAACVNLDGEQSDTVNEFLIENALHWVHEYHIDGLRLDATHALHDDKPPHFLELLAERVHDTIPGRRIPLIAEDHRNLDHMIRPEWAGGWDLDGIWADDFHHEVRRHIAGDNEGYYRDYTGEISDIVESINQGWFYTGQNSIHLGGPRGTDPVGIPPRRFVFSLQNHDQIGNRPYGDRLHHQVDAAAYRAATTLFLCCPQTPMLFMGQEWAATAPFLYFTDHDEDLGKIVTEGRRREFRHFLAFVDPAERDKIPDPQAVMTFETSKLNWSERTQEPHAATWRLYQALLKLRREESALQNDEIESFEAFALGTDAVLLQRDSPSNEPLWIVVKLSGSGPVDLSEQNEFSLPEKMQWSCIFSTEDPAFAPDPMTLPLQLDQTLPHVVFPRPGAVVLKAVRTEGK